jgi:hypothetical protein
MPDFRQRWVGAEVAGSRRKAWDTGSSCITQAREEIWQAGIQVLARASSSLVVANPSAWLEPDFEAEHIPSDGSPITPPLLCQHKGSQRSLGESLVGPLIEPSPAGGRGERGQTMTGSISLSFKGRKFLNLSRSG